MLRSATYKSPVGTLTLVGSEDSLQAVLWPGDLGRIPLPDHQTGMSPALSTAAQQLDEYFAGERSHFDVPLDPHGTAFQLQVWEALRTIPPGETRTYAAIAQQIGRPQAARAVGAANGKNPLSIFVPCHRVIGSSGSLTGFAGGLAAKRALLDLEASPPTEVRPGRR